MKVKGKVYVCGDHIDTDQIIPGKYLVRDDLEFLGQHALEGLDPEFSKKAKEEGYRIIVAGRNFGCGSSREQAPAALKGAGIELIIAKSFARIFYRNSILGGILNLVEADIADKVRTGDMLEVDLEKGVISNLNTGETYRFLKSYPKEFLEIVKAGGITAYNKKRMGIPNSSIQS